MLQKNICSKKRQDDGPERIKRTVNSNSLTTARYINLLFTIFIQKQMYLAEGADSGSFVSCYSVALDTHNCPYGWRVQLCHHVAASNGN